MAVIAIRRNAFIPLFGSSFEPNNHGFLTNVEVTKPAYQAHAVKLPCFFFEPPYQQHVFVIAQKFFG